MKKFTILTSIALVLAILLTSCGGGSSSAAPSGSTSFAAPAAKRDTLNLSILAALTTVDPHNTSNLQDRIFMYQIYDGLVWQDDMTAEIYPRIAKSWDISEDGLTYTFKLQENAKFHNGDPVLASDVVFSFKRVAESPKGRGAVDGMTDIVATDDHTVVLTLSRPIAGFISQMYQTCMILSEKEVTAQGDKFGTQVNTAGCGPYKLTSLSLDSYWECEAFADYYRGEAPIKHLTYKPISEASAGLIAFESGELDWYIAPIANWDTLVANPNYKTELVAANHISYVAINYYSGVMGDDNLRKAIAYALDKEAMSIACYNGLAIEAPYMYNADYNVAAPKGDIHYEYNLEKAKEYLAKSSMPNGGDIGQLSVSAGGYFEKMAVVMQENLAEIGLNATINRLDSATNLDNNRKQNFNITMTGGNASGDYSGLAAYVKSDRAGSYYVKYEGDKFDYKKMDSLFEQGDAETDVEKRRAIYKELDEMIMDTATLLPIFHKVQPYVWNKDLNVPTNYSNYPLVYEWSWNA